MTTAKATTTRTRRTATVDAKATTKVGSVQADATVDLHKASKPFYAYVGVADLAVEKLKALPEFYVHGVTSAQALPDSVREQINAIPTKAKGTYADLVKRGQKLVTTVRSNPSTQVAIKQAKTARSQAKAAATSARRSVNSAEQVAEDTASHAG